MMRDALLTRINLEFGGCRWGQCGWANICVLAMIALANDLGSASAQVTSSNQSPYSDHPPHIVIILLDDLGYGDLGCYNQQSKIPTPHLDSIAEQGMRFTDAHAPGPLCHLSRYGLMTGRYPFRANVGAWSKRPVIEQDRLTLPSLLKRRNYQTHMVGKWHLGFDEPDYAGPLAGGPCDRGFDSFFGIRASTDIPPYFWIRDRLAIEPPTEAIEASHSEGWTPIQGRFWRAGKIAPHMSLERVLPRMAEESIAIIRRHAHTAEASPLFLYIALPAPHTPWLPAPRFTGYGGAGLYGEFAGMVDETVGQIDAALSENNLADNTLLVVTSDNGPVWYDEDVEKFQHDSAGNLRGMKADAWEAGHRMPFIVRWPGHVRANAVSDQLLCFTDVVATCADLLELKLGAHDAPDSISFLPALLEKATEDATPRQELVMQSGGGHRVIRVGSWKLIDRLGSGGFSIPRHVTPSDVGPRGQLYNLEVDPDESQNMYLSEPDIVTKLQAALEHALNTEPIRREALPD